MTTATAPTTPDRSRSAPGRAMTGTRTLVRFMLRRDRVRLPAWALGFGVFVAYLATALPTVYETEQDLQGAVALFADPVGRMLVGPGYGFDAPSYERFVANGYGLYFVLMAALMSILLISRHTRVEEQTGRAELIRANVVGRHASLSAALIVAVVTNVAVAGMVALAMIAVGFEAGGSLLFGAGVGAGGLAFAGLTALTVQITEYSRAASGLSGIVLGAAFVLRAGGDMAEEGGNLLSWLSPIAWPQQTAPFVLDRWWPLALPLAMAAVTAALGFALSTRRDLAASLFTIRPGRDRASSWLRSSLTLAFRLQRASIIGWGVALVVGAMAFGTFVDALLGALEDMPEAFLELFGGGEDLVAGYLGYMGMFFALILSVFAILAVQGLRSEETSGRAEPVLATPVSRWAWLGSHLAITAVAVVVLSAAAGFGNGLGAAIVTGDGHHIGDLTAAQLNQAPAVLVVLGLAGLLYGLVPKALGAAWVLVAYGLVVGTFGPLLGIADAAFDLSPFEHVARMPLEAFELTPALALTAIALLVAAIALVTFRRRGINVT